MPDSRLSITSLINPLPYTPISFYPHQKFPPVPLSTLPPLPPPPAPPLTFHQAPLQASTSPQTVIVKTPRGKRHRCTFHGCGRDFTRLSNLKAHWRRHSGEEPYSCMHCTRKFKWRSSLKSHELGCVYEFTKTNAGLRWVYVSTETEGRKEVPKNEPLLRRLVEQPHVFRGDAFAEPPTAFVPQPRMGNPVEGRSYV